KKPWEMFLLGFFYSSLAVFIGYWIFGSFSSMVVILLTVMASLPLVYDAIRFEEKKDISFDEEIPLLKEHERLLLVLLMLFFGFIASFSFWYIVLPQDMVEHVFLTQTKTISAINSPTGSFAQQISVFSLIFLNNVKVLLFCVLFSFLYGSGALFILTWNASVIGTAIGNFMRNEIARYSLVVGFVPGFTYLKIYGLATLRYLLHGIPEIGAYLVAGLAGGIISAAIVRHDLSSKKFEKVVLDTADLLVISLVMLFIAGLLEVFVTPIFFS
ncbi:hypothetical protein DRN75_04005, partial [Nanoarchaeota archaeon]